MYCALVAALPLLTKKSRVCVCVCVCVLADDQTSVCSLIHHVDGIASSPSRSATAAFNRPADHYYAT